MGRGLKFFLSFFFQIEMTAGCPGANKRTQNFLSPEKKVKQPENFNVSHGKFNVTSQN